MNDQTPERQMTSASHATVYTVRAQDPEFPFMLSVVVTDDENMPSYFSLANANRPEHEFMKLPLRALEQFGEMFAEACALTNVSDLGDDLDDFMSRITPGGHDES